MADSRVGRFSLPALGRVFFNHDLLIYAVVPLAFLLAWLLARTCWGLSLRTVGEDKTVAYAAGLQPTRLQYQAVFIGGLLAGPGGAHLSLLHWRLDRTDDSRTRLYCGGAGHLCCLEPVRAVWGALSFFGGALAFQLQLQARCSHSPLDMLPYLLTLGVLLALRKRPGYTMPAGLSSVFEGMRS